MSWGHNSDKLAPRHGDSLKTVPMADNLYNPSMRYKVIQAPVIQREQWRRQWGEGRRVLMKGPKAPFHTKLNHTAKAFILVTYQIKKLKFSQNGKQINVKGARSRCEYAHWVLPIYQLYVSDFYCSQLCLTRSRARGCKSRHLQVVLVTYCGVWCEIITVQCIEILLW